LLVSLSSPYLQPILRFQKTVRVLFAAVLVHIFYRLNENFGDEAAKYCSAQSQFQYQCTTSAQMFALTLQSPVVTICTTSLTFTNSTFWPHSCIYVFCVDLRTNSDYFPIQHQL